MTRSEDVYFLTALVSQDPRHTCYKDRTCRGFGAGQIRSLSPCGKSPWNSLIFHIGVCWCGFCCPTLQEWLGAEDDLTAKKKKQEALRSSPRENIMDRTTVAARDIVEGEARKRHELTLSLRAARLAREGELSANPPPKSKSRR